MFFFNSQAQASDYGCSVLLCLANPSGPMAVSECVPPIQQLFRDLLRFKPFPTCVLASGPDGQSYAKQGTSYYEVCPPETIALDSGVYAIQGSKIQKSDDYLLSQQGVRLGIGTGDGLQPGNGEDYAPLKAKVCVGNKIGQVDYVLGSGDDARNIITDVYDRVVILDPQDSPRIIDVFINNELYRRVRW